VWEDRDSFVNRSLLRKGFQENFRHLDFKRLAAKPAPVVWFLFAELALLAGLKDVHYEA
jgi:hypothetical protein